MPAEQMIFDRVPGGRALFSWFDTDEPDLGDSEIVSLLLSRKGQTQLRIHCYRRTGRATPAGEEIYKHAMVIFTFNEVMDLQLDGFSHQNVIGGLRLIAARDRGRSGYFGRPGSPEDIDLELQPCYGLDGWIRARAVTLAIEPGIPADTPHRFTHPDPAIPSEAVFGP